MNAADSRKKYLKIGELIGRFELSNTAEGKSPKTVLWYSEMLSAFLKYMKTKRMSQDLSSFTREIVRGYILYLKGKPKYEGHPFTPKQSNPVSPRTVQCHVRALKAFSSWLNAEGYTPENRLKYLKLPKAPMIVIEPLSYDETKTIFASINKNSSTGARNHTILETMLDSGLRASEVANINLNRVNLKDGYLKVRGKGAKERIAPIGKHVRMFSYIDKARPKPIDPALNCLFLSQTGKPITSNTIKLVFSRPAKKSGVNRLHAHLCRHTFAINYLLNGGDIFSLKEILGHTTSDMVNHYLHFTSAQITAQHHKYSPMDKFQGLEQKEFITV
jgi:site-specific recombinase XerD